MTVHFYLDFEATQWSEKIISIGCFTDQETEFYSLCKPVGKAKLTPFITQLTGITEEMLAAARSAERVFFDFFLWVAEQVEANPGPTFFHAYGNTDAEFLAKTAKYIENPEIQELMYSTSRGIIDDSKEVCRFFHSKGIGIHKALSYFVPDLPPQTHNSLDDAVMLYYTMDFIKRNTPLNICPYEECEKEHKDKKQVIQPKQAHNGYIIRAKHATDKNAKERIFYSEQTAISFAYDKIKKKTPNVQYKTVKKNLVKKIDSGATYVHYIWTREEVNKEVN